MGDLVERVPVAIPETRDSPESDKKARRDCSLSESRLFRPLPDALTVVPPINKIVAHEIMRHDARINCCILIMFLLKVPLALLDNHLSIPLNQSDLN